MRLLNVLSIVVGKIVSSASQLLHLGAGATWSGEIALRLQPHILTSLISRLNKGVILIAGTNGKTTTALMIKTILEAQGLRVVHNASGANLLNGIVAACIQESSWTGELHADYGVFEVDENVLPGVMSNVKCQMSNERQKLIVVLLNLFRDQLDRYGEVDVIAEKWERALREQHKQGQQESNTSKKNTMQLIVNADDPLIVYLASRPGLEARVSYFGLDDASQFQKTIEHATDSTFCPSCGARLHYRGIYFSHIGVWQCSTCKVKRPTLDVREWEYPLPGLYNRYNTLAAVAASRAMGVSDNEIRSALKGFTPAFGRQEEFVVNGRTVKIFLSKNPAGFNEALRTVISLDARHILLVLNDRIPDGRDVSWIWDVDFEMIPKHISVRVAGDRVYDLALRLKYAGINVTVYEDLPEALKTSESLYVLPTYSAMLEVRKILKGRKIL